MPSWQALRTTEDWAKCRHIFRFEACLVRARSRLNSIYCLGIRDVCLSFRIDESCKIKDMRVLAKMLEDGELKHTPASGNSLFEFVFAAEQEVWAAQHYDPKIFKTDPGGIVYQRFAMFLLPSTSVNGQLDKSTRSGRAVYIGVPFQGR